MMKGSFSARIKCALVLILFMLIPIIPCIIQRQGCATFTLLKIHLARILKLDYEALIQ